MRWLSWSSLVLEGEVDLSPSVILLLPSALLLRWLSCSNSQTQQKAGCYFWEKGRIWENFSAGSVLS